MSNGFRWSVALEVDEMWLNSDREVLGRSRQEQGQNGVLFTVMLPNGQEFQAELDKLNAETGSGYCMAAREYYNEWKANKEAAASRKQRDREQQSILDASGSKPAGGPEVGSLTVQETVEALEAPVYGVASLEEEIVLRLDDAYGRRSKLNEQIEQLKRELVTAETEVTQLETMTEVFHASKVLEQASGSVPEVREDRPDSHEGVDGPARSSEDVTEGGEGA